MKAKTVDLGSVAEVLTYVGKALHAMKLAEAENAYRQLAEQLPGHAAVDKAKAMISEFLRFRFAEFLDDDQQISDLYRTYLAGISKKIDITRDIPGFSEMARLIVAEGRTLLYFDRLYTLFQAVEHIAHLGGDIIELGVYQGGSLKFIAERCQQLDLSIRIFGLDTFCGHAGVSTADFTQAEKQFSNTSLSDVTSYVAGCRAVTLVQGDVRLTLKGLLENVERVALAHLDLDLWEPTEQALCLLAPKMVLGSTIVIDDYGSVSCQGVRKATDDFAEKAGLRRMHLLTGQCLLVKV